MGCIQDLRYFILIISILYNIFTCIKYLPQIIYNYKKKTTHGWNIYNTHFDIAGGLFLLVELIINTVANKSIKILYSNVAKLNLIII